MADFPQSKGYVHDLEDENYKLRQENGRLKAMLEAANVIVLSPADQKLLADTLANPPEPTQALRDLFSRAARLRDTQGTKS